MTESGYLMLVKSFNDDLAWQVQRCLVNAYFKVKEVFAGNCHGECDYAQMKEQISLWKQKVSNPLVERLIFLSDAEDIVSAYTRVYKDMRKTYGFDMNKAKFDYCNLYGVDYDNCAVIDCVASNVELRKASEKCAARQVRDLSEDRLEQTKRVAERKIREAEEFVKHSEEIIQKAETMAESISLQGDAADSERDRCLAVEAGI